jgi:hypothetical protein
MRNIKRDERKELRIKKPIVSFQIYLIISISIFTSVFLGALNVPIVSAEEESGITQCCTSGTSACTDLPYDTCDEQCGGDCEATVCNTLSQCQLGCGFDNIEGTCTPNTPKSLCEDSEDCEFFEDPFCNVNQCDQGCCVLGGNAQLATQTQCQTLSSRLGVPSEFDSSITDAVECLNVVNVLNEGACVFPGDDEKDNCKFTTLSDCNDNINGDFYDGKFCSDPSLNTVCEAEARTGCFEGRDEVFYYDSCGNRENIHERGDCDYETGSICGEYRVGIDSKNLDGYTCRDLNCRDSNGKKRINGESWCIYDGHIGEQEVDTGVVSGDVVGSRHIREVCINGEVQVEPCSDYRKEICVQNEQELSNGQEIDTAICRVNLWDQCYSANSEGNDIGSCDAGTDCADLCLDNPDCRLQNVNVDSSFRFNTCVPEHPPGFDLGSITYGESSILPGSDICALGSRTCVVVYKKSASGKWKCKENCNCQNKEFTKQMNNLCVSMGDCGAYVNINEEITSKGYGISRSGGKASAPPKFNTTNGELEKLYQFLAQDSRTNEDDGGFFKEEPDILDLGDEGLADPFLSSYISDIPDFTDVGFQDALFAPTTMIAAAVGAFVTSAAAGGVSAFLTGGLAAITICWVCVVVVIIIIIIVAILGIGKTKVTEITFECEPWERPNGGDSCSLCGSDGKPCTQYRCESLGKRCELINENTGQDECISIEGEEGIPIISPWEDVLNTSLHSYRDVSTNGFKVRTSNGECIQAFTPITLGVNTNIIANCKYDVENLEYDDMNYDFIEGGIFTRNHTLFTILPSVDSIIATEIHANESLNESDYQYVVEQFGEFDLHIKCANLDGDANDVDYRINFCVDPGPDLTPPIVTNTDPENGATIRLDATEQDAIIYISEPVDCKYDVLRPVGSDLDAFNSLTNSLECPSDADGATFLGYPCTGTLAIENEENDYYIMCRDQPWLGDNSSRNIGSVYEYNLKRTENALIIDSILPEGTIVAGDEPITVTLEVSTSGGVSNGYSICEYSLNDGNYINFFDSNNNVHRQLLSQMVAGSYTLDVRCEDSIGNSASGESSFNLELDTTAPIVNRVFNSGGSLLFQTNEKATCYYRNDSTSQCGFTFTEGIEMLGVETITHNTAWEEDQTYYIKCKDVWGNQPNECNIVVKPYSL